LFGDSGNDTLSGSQGSDQLDGGDGKDELTGGNGADQLTGDNGNDRLVGNSGNDALSGGNGRDELLGGGGSDRLNGGNGKDDLTGGSGRDLFVLTTNSGRDTIRDFQLGQDLIGLGSNLTVASLTIIQTGANTVISSGGKQLALVLNTQASLLSGANFTLA
jgi:Ca2+-binding RTX toxin-like protein